METYQGTFADITYDRKVIRIISKDSMAVHPILPETDSDRQFYIDYLQVGKDSGDMQSCVDDIVANEIEKHPRKMSILLAKLGKIAFVKDWACGDKIRRLN